MQFGNFRDSVFIAALCPRAIVEGVAKAEPESSHRSKKYYGHDFT